MSALLKIPVGVRKAKIEDVFTADYRLVENRLVFIKYEGSFLALEKFGGNESFQYWLRVFYAGCLYVLVDDSSEPDSWFRLYVAAADKTDLFDTLGRPYQGTVFYHKKNDQQLEGPLRLSGEALVEPMQQLIDQNKIFVVYHKQLFEPVPNALNKAS